MSQDGSRLKNGDAVIVDTPDEEYAGTFIRCGEDFLTLRQLDQFLYIPRGDVITIRKPVSATVEA